MLVGAMVAAAVFGVAEAPAQTSASTSPLVSLKLVEQLSPTHYWSINGAQAWMEAVTKRTERRVVFKHYPAEQLVRAKDMLDALSRGLADVGYLPTTNSASQMSLIGNVTSFPIWTDPVDGTKALFDASTDNGSILENDFHKNNIQPVIIFANSEFRLCTRAKKVRRVGDIKGLRIRGAGGVSNDIIRAFGATPVQLSAPELYEAMQRGIVDGVLLPGASVPLYHIDELATFCNWGVGIPGGAMVYAINVAVWKRLPEDVRRIMIEEGERVSIRTATAIRQRDKVAMQALQGRSIEIYEPTSEEAREWRDGQKSVENNWVAKMIERGVDPSQVLNQLRDASTHTVKE